MVVFRFLGRPRLFLQWCIRYLPQRARSGWVYVCVHYCSFGWGAARCQVVRERGRGHGHGGDVRVLVRALGSGRSRRLRRASVGGSICLFPPEGPSHVTNCEHAHAHRHTRTHRHSHSHTSARVDGGQYLCMSARRAITRDKMRTRTDITHTRTHIHSHSQRIYTHNPQRLCLGLTFSCGGSTSGNGATR